MSRATTRVIGSAMMSALVWVGGCSNGLASGPKVGAEPPAIASDEVGAVSFEGRVTVLEFWAVWCGPCRKTSPNVQALHERYVDDPGVRVIAVHVDTNYGKYDTCQDYLAEHGYTYDVIADGRAIRDEYGIKTLPAIVVIGVDGTVIKRQWGLYKSEVDSMSEFINQYLAEQAG